MEKFFSIHTATRRYCINLIDSINQKYELFEQMLSSININDGKEKRNLNKFIHHFTRDSLSKIKPLFYRRCISAEEVNRVNSKLMKTLKESPLIKDNLLTFKEESFDLDREILIEILRKYKNDRVYEINTGTIGSNSYILDIEALNLQRNDGFNIYWCSEQVDWIIEKNHEGWYHFYGDWFTKELNNKDIL